MLLFKLERRLVLVVILSLFVASFAFSVYLTPIDPIAAFYLPWTRGWELALGALVAYREVFWLEALPYPSRRIANIGAGAGIALMLGAFLFLNETQPFPGWLAAIPTAWLGAGHRQSAIRFPARSRSAIASPASSA